MSEENVGLKSQMHMFAIIFLKKGYKIKIIYGNLEGRKV